MKFFFLRFYSSYAIAIFVIVYVLPWRIIFLTSLTHSQLFFFCFWEYLCVFLKFHFHFHSFFLPIIKIITLLLSVFLSLFLIHSLFLSLNPQRSNKLFTDKFIIFFSFFPFFSFSVSCFDISVRWLVSVMEDLLCSKTRKKERNMK